MIPSGFSPSSPPSVAASATLPPPIDSPMAPMLQQSHPTLAYRQREYSTIPQAPPGPRGEESANLEGVVDRSLVPQWPLPGSRPWDSRIEPPADSGRRGDGPDMGKTADFVKPHLISCLALQLKQASVAGEVALSCLSLSLMCCLLILQHSLLFVPATRNSRAKPRLSWQLNSQGRPLSRYCRVTPSSLMQNSTLFTSLTLHTWHSPHPYRHACISSPRVLALSFSPRLFHSLPRMVVQCSRFRVLRYMLSLACRHIKLQVVSAPHLHIHPYPSW